MVGKKVDPLEERLEGEVGNLKSEFGNRISAMENRFARVENRFSGMEEMLKKALGLPTKTTASEARAPSIVPRSGGNPNMGGRREDREEEVMGEDKYLPYLEAFPMRGGEERYDRRRKIGEPILEREKLRGRIDIKAEEDNIGVGVI